MRAKRDTRARDRARRLAAPVIVAAAALVSLAGAASAQALTVTGTAQPVNPQAGAHSNVNININFGPADQNVDDLRIGLPPGLIGDPTATPLCTVAQLNADACPAASQVGTVTANATVTVLVVPVTLDVNGTLYNLEAQPGEPARFGIVLRPVSIPPLPPLLPPVIMQSGVELRPDFGLDTVVNNIPETTSGLPTHINSMSLTLLGTANGQPFMRNPTSCAPATTTFTASPHPPATGSASDTDEFTPTDCGSLPFSPGFSARAGAPGATAPPARSPVTTVISQTEAEAGLKTATVFLPSELGTDLTVLENTCSEADFLNSACPPSNIIGGALAQSAVLNEPLVGPVVLIATPGLPRVGLDLQGPLHLLLQGDFQIAASTGVQFDGLPDIPILNFALTFNGGPSGLVIPARDLCLPPAPLFSTDFVGHNGATQSGQVAATIEGCGPASASPGGKGSGAKKCKAKKKRKKGKKSEASAAKKKKKKSCKRRKRKKKK